MGDAAAKYSRQVFLLPGEVHFTTQERIIKTVLGSCIAIVLWEPSLKYGGMCHYVMSSRSPGSAQGRDGRYAEDAFALLLEALRHHGTQLCQYRVGIYGGGWLFRKGTAAQGDVGQRNADIAYRMLERERACIVQANVGGAIYRNITFDVATGELILRETPVLENEHRSRT